MTQDFKKDKNEGPSLFEKVRDFTRSFRKAMICRKGVLVVMRKKTDECLGNLNFLRLYGQEKEVLTGLQQCFAQKTVVAFTFRTRDLHETIEYEADILITTQSEIKKQTKEKQFQTFVSSLKFNSYTELCDYCRNITMQDISTLTQGDLVAILNATQLFFSERLNELAEKFGLPKVKCEMFFSNAIGSPYGTCDYTINTIRLNGKLLSWEEFDRHGTFVHELCHLKFPHHKESFWKYCALLMSKDYPEYADCESERDFTAVYNRSCSLNDNIFNTWMLQIILEDFYGYGKYKKFLS